MSNPQDDLTEVLVTEPLYENEVYNIEIGHSFNDGRRLYLVVNKNTAVVEAETSVLPQAMQFAETFLAGLKEWDKRKIPGGGIAVPRPPKILVPEGTK